MATLALINKVTSSADSATNIVYGIDLTEVTSMVTAATTCAFTFGNDGGAANTITFTVTGGTPASSADFLISDDAAGEKMKNVARLVDWFMGAVSASKNSKTHKIFGLEGQKGLTQKQITAQAGLTFGGATTEPLVSIGVA
jgi:hypothetical protein|tara:strand:- start:34 stop:456 length:423 start_codon:yes stop_codon:yes gene_type:complete